MPIQASTGDNAFDTGDSGQAEANFRRIASQVLHLLEVRNQQVSVVMEHYDATGVAPEYQGKEKAWHTKGDNTRQTITLLEQCLVEDRGHAEDANKRAGNFVAGMM